MFKMPSEPNIRENVIGYGYLAWNNDINTISTDLLHTKPVKKAVFVKFTLPGAQQETVGTLPHLVHNKRQLSNKTHDTTRDTCQKQGKTFRNVLQPCYLFALFKYSFTF